MLTGRDGNLGRGLEGRAARATGQVVLEPEELLTLPDGALLVGAEARTEKALRSGGTLGVDQILSGTRGIFLWQKEIKN